MLIDKLGTRCRVKTLSRAARARSSLASRWLGQDRSVRALGRVRDCEHNTFREEKLIVYLYAVRADGGCLIVFGGVLYGGCSGVLRFHKEPGHGMSTRLWCIQQIVLIVPLVFISMYGCKLREGRYVGQRQTDLLNAVLECWFGPEVSRITVGASNLNRQPFLGSSWALVWWDRITPEFIVIWRWDSCVYYKLARNLIRLIICRPYHSTTYGIDPRGTGWCLAMPNLQTSMIDFMQVMRTV